MLLLSINSEPKNTWKWQCRSELQLPPFHTQLIFLVSSDLMFKRKVHREGKTSAEGSLFSLKWLNQFFSGLSLPTESRRSLNDEIWPYARYLVKQNAARWIPHQALHLSIKSLPHMSLGFPHLEGKKIVRILVTHKAACRVFQQVLLIAHKWMPAMQLLFGNSLW